MNHASVKDENGVLWNLPPYVVIPPEGQILVTVTAYEEGDIRASAGTINQINTPILGWQSFVSVSDAAPGAPVESDGALRQRQSQSTNIPAITQLGAVAGALADLPGVTRLKAYENDTLKSDENGIPAKSISLVVQGGDLKQIATAIGQKKAPGAATYGSTSQKYTDPKTGIVSDIRFFRLEDIDVSIRLVLKMKTGYSSDIEKLIRQSLSEYINSLGIGESVEFRRLDGPAYLYNTPEGYLYKIESLKISSDGQRFEESDIAVPFNKAAFCNPENIVITPK